MRWILLISMIVVFGYSVTLKYMPTEPAFTPMGRYVHVLERRPAFPLVQYVNEYQPNAKVFISYLDEYRAWFECETMGRRMWRDSWAEYKSIYPENSARGLNEYLSDRDCTHIMVAPNGPFELPTEDEEWHEYFEKESYYETFDLWAVLALADEPPEFAGINSDYLGTNRPYTDTKLQE